jgi:hypothetical protein
MSRSVAIRGYRPSSAMALRFFRIGFGLLVSGGDVALRTVSDRQGGGQRPGDASRSSRPSTLSPIFRVGYEERGQVPPGVEGSSTPADGPDTQSRWRAREAARGAAYPAWVISEIGCIPDDWRTPRDRPEYLAFASGKRCARRGPIRLIGCLQVDRKCSVAPPRGDCDIPNCIRPTPSYRTQLFNSLPVLTDLLTFRARPGCGRPGRLAQLQRPALLRVGRRGQRSLFV